MAQSTTMGHAQEESQESNKSEPRNSPSLVQAPEDILVIERFINTFKSKELRNRFDGAREFAG
jgi:hypothetical protein